MPQKKKRKNNIYQKLGHFQSPSNYTFNKSPQPSPFFPIFDTMEQDSKVIDKKEVEKLERIASILKTVAHPLRLGVVHLLEQNPELTVSNICEMLDSEQSLTSHHLQTMRLKGILISRRDGRSIYYSLKEKDVSLLIECLANCQC